MKYLTKMQIERIHRDALAHSGGESGIHSPSILEGCAKIPRSAFYELEAYSTILAKAASLLHCIVTQHPFVDGNKRTGWISAKMFLRYNGYRILASIDEAEEMVLKVAKGELEVNEIESWFENQCVREN